MILSWIDLHFDAESKRRTTNVFRYSLDEPYFPRIEISQLLRPESGVTDETKSRIVDYIQTKGILLTSLDNWLRQLPEGAEKWIVPVARLGLDDPLNRVRKRSAAILATAGVEYTPPTLRPNPRFRILVNGENWPGRLNIDTHLSLSIRANTAGFAGDLEDSRDGIVTCDADCFFESGDVTSAEIYDYPYIRGQIPLPVNFEKIGTVNIVTRKLIISPIFPDLATSPEDRTYAVELDPFEEGHKPDGRSHCRIVKNHEPCIYPNVTPGEYWLRVRSAGAELEDRQRLTIGNNDEVIRPRLKKGSSLVVPLEWPEGFDPKTLPPELGSDWPESLGEIVKIMGVTSRMDQESIPIPEAAEGRFPNSMIFPYLPPGKYTVEAPARTVEPSGVDPGCVIQPSSISAEVREDSPIFVITAPLKILYRKKEKAL
jgi:hypothetical protein